MFTNCSKFIKETKRGKRNRWSQSPTNTREHNDIFGLFEISNKCLVNAIRLALPKHRMCRNMGVPLIDKVEITETCRLSPQYRYASRCVERFTKCKIQKVLG